MNQPQPSRLASLRDHHAAVYLNSIASPPDSGQYWQGRQSKIIADYCRHLLAASNASPSQAYAATLPQAQALDQEYSAWLNQQYNRGLIGRPITITISADSLRYTWQMSELLPPSTGEKEPTC